MEETESRKEWAADGELEFTKMHGAGNDFIVLDGIGAAVPLVESFTDLAASLLHRRFGVGGDQLLIARPGRAAPFCMEIYNPDGSRAEMCANGIRAFYKWLRDRGYTERDEVAVETLAGVVQPRWVGADRITVDVGPPVLSPIAVPTTLRANAGGPKAPAVGVPLAVGDHSVTLSAISMGNPHAVLFVDSVDTAPVRELGPMIEWHSAFPNRTNVEFAEVVSEDRVRQRTWERGTAETLACGSGACAVAVVSVLRGVVGSKLTVELSGGELEIEWAGPGTGVFMTGPAAEVFTGRVSVKGA